MLLAEIALKEQDFETAQKESTEILALNPKDFRARMMLGNALMAQGKAADAEIAFKTVIAEQPKNPAGYYRLGLLQRARKLRWCPGKFQCGLEPESHADGCVYPYRFGPWR
jgi:predicted Zn-dependent protease